MTKKEKAMEVITNAGYKITFHDHDKISFWFKGNAVHYFFNREWASGKGIQDCRGLDNLIKQISK